MSPRNPPAPHHALERWPRAWRTVENRLETCAESMYHRSGRTLLTFADARTLDRHRIWLEPLPILVRSVFEFERAPEGWVWPTATDPEGWTCNVLGAGPLEIFDGEGKSVALGETRDPSLGCLVCLGATLTHHACRVGAWTWDDFSEALPHLVATVLVNTGRTPAAWQSTLRALSGKLAQLTLERELAGATSRPRPRV